MKILIDTNTFIELFRKKEMLLLQFAELAKDGEFFYAPIIEAELLQGAQLKEIAHINNVLSKMTCLPIIKETGALAGKFSSHYRKSHNAITLDDFFIAAVAKQYDCFLWTLNKKHFPMFETNEMI